VRIPAEAAAGGWAGGRRCHWSVCGGVDAGRGIPAIIDTLRITAVGGWWWGIVIWCGWCLIVNAH